MALSRIALGLATLIGAVLLSSQPMWAATNRAVSLKALQNSLKSGTSRTANNLYGISLLTGFVTDRDGKDIILTGRVDPGLPDLHLDDLAVAIRAAKYVYGKREGRTIYYTPPGCSIDPNPEVIRQLQQFRMVPGDPESVKGWDRIGAQPHSVRVMGVPFDSRFAKVMVDADYYMKRLVNGSVDLGIEGFQSLNGMRYDLAERNLENGSRDDASGLSMNRFWFCPGECTYTEDDGAVLVKDCAVKLLTEEEFIAASGKTSGTGRSSALAQRFADSFTSHYSQIAEQRPIYAELEGLFRLAAVAKLMEERKVEASSGANLDYLTNRHSVDAVAVSRTLPGLTRVQELKHREDSERGYTITTLALMSCGGVSMDVRPRRIGTPKSAKPSSTAVNARTSVRKSVLSGRKSKDAVYWDFQTAG